MALYQTPQVGQKEGREDLQKAKGKVNAFWGAVYV